MEKQLLSHRHPASQDDLLRQKRNMNPNKPPSLLEVQFRARRRLWQVS
jgi:hypothetical protein